VVAAIFSGSGSTLPWDWTITVGLSISVTDSWDVVEAVSPLTSG
jgi:hypothetical protein